MLILQSTDTLEVVTDTARTVDVHASFIDFAAASPLTTPGRQNTAITTATTTTVVSSPAGSDLRNVKTLMIRNKEAAQSVVVTIRHNGGTIVELKRVTLAADQELHYVDGLGFLML